MTDTAANGNFIGTCTYVIGNQQAYFCSGVYNIDQFYDINTNTQVAKGPCAGSIALVEPAVVTVPSVPDNQPVTGGTGAYRGASGNAIITTINDPTKCPLGATSCYKIDFNLD